MPPAPLPQAVQDIYILIETCEENNLSLTQSSSPCLEGFSLGSLVQILSAHFGVRVG